jgi:hypothetical protein
MENQHQHIDTASDLRDLIAQTPEETEAPRLASPIRVELQKDDFAELRLSLLRLRDELYYSFNSKPEAINEMIEKADKALQKTSWSTVKYIF